MIEITILNYLNNELTPGVYMEKPDSPPEEFIIIEKTSGTVEDSLYNATLAVQSYADSLANAMLLNEDVKAAMLEAPAKIAAVSRVALNSDYNFTDQAKKKYRYQAIFDIWYFEQ